MFNVVNDSTNILEIWLVNVHLKREGGVNATNGRHLFFFGTVLDDTCELNVVEPSFWVYWGTMEHLVAFLFSKSVGGKLNIILYEKAVAI